LNGRSLGDSIAEILKGGTPEAEYVAQIVPATIGRAKELLPNTNPVLQQITGDAAGFVLMTDRFNPDDAGGRTTETFWKRGDSLLSCRSRSDTASTHLLIWAQSGIFAFGDSRGSTNISINVGNQLWQKLLTRI
jgi:hypothetical protein